MHILNEVRGLYCGQFDYYFISFQLICYGHFEQWTT